MGKTKPIKNDLSSRTKHRKWKLPEVSCKHGAPMGRASIQPSDADTFAYNFHVQQLCWVDGAYDEGGAYWGRGGFEYIYWCEHKKDENGREARAFIRANSDRLARERLLEIYPLATFNHK